MQTVLIVDDDKLLLEGIKSFLDKDFRVLGTSSVCEAERILAETDCHLALVDVNLPDGNGLQLCEHIQNKCKNTQVIFLSGSFSDVDTKIRGFERGGEDFIEKPFNPLELRARIQARLRNRKQPKTQIAGKVRIDLVQQKAFVFEHGKEKDIFATPIEFRLLSHFINNQENTISRESLMQAAWGKDCHVSLRTVDKHICSLRNRLKDFQSLIATIPQKGYRFSSDHHR